MDSRRKSLPPLDTLVFFETASRAGSFSAAASELYVSQAAVSKRIKQLEDWLGDAVFERGARGLALTPTGAKLADPVAMALDYLQNALAEVRSPPASSIRIAANSAVSVFWLFKRLRSFALSPESCPIETVITDDPRELLSEANDIAIIYADAVPQGWSGHLLIKEELAPVASPEGAKRFADTPETMHLLDYRRHAPDWINWEVWQQHIRQSAFHSLPKEMCQNYSHSIGRALAGQGIALASCALLEEELATGQLVVLGDAPMNTGRGYYLVWPHHKDPPPKSKDLIGHLGQS